MTHMRRLDQKFSRLALSALLLPTLAQAAPPLFARLAPDRPNPYAGEAFLLTLRVHVTGVNLDNQVSLSALPDPADLQLRGFEELPIESETVDGLVYQVRPFRTWARAPKTGPLTLAPLLEGTRVQTTRSHFFMQESRSPFRIAVAPLALSIRPLPDTGRPADFSGLVGPYGFHVSAAPLDIASGDLITLTLTLEGDWIPEAVALPVLPASSGLKVYEAKLVSEESSPVRQVFRQTVVPQSPVLAALPGLTLSYFDPETGAYRSQAAGPFPITYHAERTPAVSAGLPPHNQTPPVTSQASPPKSPTTSLGKRWSPWTGKRVEVVRGTGDILVRFAPDQSARELFRLPPGTEITIDSTHEEWLRVSSPAGIGWIRRQDTGP